MGSSLKTCLCPLKSIYSLRENFKIIKYSRASNTKLEGSIMAHQWHQSEFSYFFNNKIK